ncbi:MAG: hypothetical protein Fur0012_06860 [Elusimicrobiota bacterium]
MIKLMIKYESSFIKEFKTASDSVSIGRKAENDLVLDNPTVSGHHCKIYKAGDSYFIEDLNSTNGTFVNSKKVIKSGIKEKDVIGIVKYSLIFSCGEQNTQEKIDISEKEMLEKTQSKYLDPQKTRAILEIIENPVDSQTEYEIKAVSTYIGKAGKANIPAKASNIFSSLPELAAVITFRSDGYYLNPLKEGILKYNGDDLKEKVVLKNEDIIVVGATRFKFILKKT